VMLRRSTRQSGVRTWFIPGRNARKTRARLRFVFRPRSCLVISRRAEILSLSLSLPHPVFRDTFICTRAAAICTAANGKDVSLGSRQSCKYRFHGGISSLISRAEIRERACVKHERFSINDEPRFRDLRNSSAAGERQNICRGLRLLPPRVFLAKLRPMRTLEGSSVFLLSDAIVGCENANGKGRIRDLLDI